MIYTDTIINQYDDADFKTAFRQYFGELGCHVNNWDGLFAEMGKAHREYTWTQRDKKGCIMSFTAWMNENERDHTYVRRDDSGAVIGFIQFTTMNMGSWFFTAKCGFIRESWIMPELRRQGHGSELLNKAEEWLYKEGCAYVLLTTDTAPEFYRKHGYTLQKGIAARNKDEVYVKLLQPPLVQDGKL